MRANRREPQFDFDVWYLAEAIRQGDPEEIARRVKRIAKHEAAAQVGLALAAVLIPLVLAALFLRRLH